MSIQTIADGAVGVHWGDLVILAVAVLLVVVIVAIVRKVRSMAGRGTH